MWYVTIDDYDYFQYNNSHEGNLVGLQSVVEQSGIQVDPIWMGNLRDEFLADGTLLALFGAGSFPEWFFAASKPEWGKYLDNYCDQIRNTKVPMLAVCGTHQFIAKAFSDWSSVGHMARINQPIQTIADEFAKNTSLIPTPRLGEVGVFPFQPYNRTNRDQLLAGLPESSRFEEYHHDYICEVNARFLHLLKPDPSSLPVFGKTNGIDHIDPYDVKYRCKVQALRLNDPNRVLYTTQFHPEGSPYETDGTQLIRNFIGIAKNFWLLH